MKKFSFLMMASALIGSMTVVGCGRRDKNPESDLEKVSYSIGQQIGSNIKAQDIKIDSEMFAQAVREAAQGKESRMNQQDMQAAMMQMQKERMEQQEKNAEENMAVGKKWLDENKAKDGVKTTSTGLQYKVVTEGTGKAPKADDMVKVHYKGTLINGEEFDSSYKRDRPAEFPLKGVIPGWTEALQLMKTGAKYQLFIPPDLGYGKMARPKIPANSVLVFDVELLEILPKAKK